MAADDRPRSGLLDTLTGPLTARSAVLQVLTGLVVGGVVFGLGAGAVLASSGADEVEERTAVVVTGGSVGRVQAQAVADELGWTVERTTYLGAGIGSRSPSGGQPITVQLRDEAGVKTADVVVVQGGEADTKMAPDTLDNAAVHLIDWLQEYATATDVVLMGPVPGSEQSPQELVGVDAVLSDAAQAEGLPYLSAIEAGLSRTDPEFGSKLAVALQRVVESD